MPKLRDSVPLLGDVESMRRALATLGLRMSAPLGFNNTYAIGMKKTEASGSMARLKRTNP